MRQMFRVVLCLGMLSSLLAVAGTHQPAAMAQTLPVVAGDASMATTDRSRDLGPHDPKAPLAVALGLQLRNQASLVDFIATQASQGKYLTQGQFRQTYGAPSDQILAVKEWATSRGLQVTYISGDGLTITLHGPTLAFEAALGVTIDDFVTERGVQFYANEAEPQGLPAQLGVQTITGLNDYPRLHTADPQGGTGPGGTYFPSDFRRLYDLDGHGYDGTGQTIGLILWGGRVPDSDFAGFAAATGDPPVSACNTCSDPDRIEWIGVDGNDATVPASGNSGSEAVMDAEYAHGMALHSHLKFWLSDGSASGVQDSVSLAANADPVVHDISNSWGYQVGSSLSDPFVLATTTSFMHAVAVGATFYVASGDLGEVTPDYPTESPYVVSVGGTSLYQDGAAYAGEIAFAGSGGGCSALFARPAWQARLASPCALSDGTPARGYPDISANSDAGTPGYVFWNGSDSGGAGTSLATPMLAGMAAVTDRYLNVHGMPGGLGWAAPTLYRLAGTAAYHSHFHDVVCGSNGTDAASNGWDPVTGLGSIDWYNLAQGAAGIAVAPVDGPLYSWRCLNSRAVGDLTSISCTSAAVCTALGNGSAVRVTADAGRTWTDPLGSISQVDCPTASICYAGGPAGMLKSTDFGASWSRLPGAPSLITSFTCTSALECTTVSFAGVIRHTTDGGATWPAEVSGTSQTLSHISCPDALTCFAVGVNGTILSTTTGGASWTSQTNPLSGSSSWIQSVSCPTALVCFTAGDAGAVLATTNGGAVWSSIDSQTINYLYGIACPSVTTCYAVDGFGNVHLTTTGGSSWATEDTGTHAWLLSITCPSSGTCYTSGLDGALTSTTDGGRTWTPGPDRNFARFIGTISCTSVTTCIAVGDKGTILRTITSGATWAYLAGLTETPRALVCPPGAPRCYAVGAFGTIFGSAMDGSLWMHMPNPVENTLTTLRGLACQDGTTCYAVGDGGTVLSTRDGTSWTAQTSGSTEQLNGVACPGMAMCYAVGDAGTILRADDGVTWRPLSSGISTRLNAITCLSFRECYAVGEGGVILHTSDGTSWTPQPSGTGADLRAVTCTAGCFAVGGAPGTTVSLYPSGWHQESNPLGTTARSLLAISCPTSSTCYVAGENTTIMKRGLLLVFHYHFIPHVRALIELGGYRPDLGTISGLVSSMEAKDQLGPGAVEQVVAYTIDGTPRVYIPGQSPDIKLEPGAVLEVRTKVTGDWTLTAFPFEEGRVVHLGPGINTVGAPYPLKGLTTEVIANQIAEAGGTVADISVTGTDGKESRWRPGDTPFLVPATSGMRIHLGGGAAVDWVPRDPTEATHSRG